MSPWMTISRCRSARYSPGTCCQTGSPFCSPKAIRRSAVALGEEDAPAVLLHGDVVEVGPALTAHGDRRAQVHVLGGHGRAHRLPPVEEVGLPALQRALQLAVAGQVDVVRDLLGVVDRHDSLALRLACGRSRPCVPCRTCAARRRGRTALGRTKIQFCQAVSREKICVSMVSGPTNRWLASMPVSASGVSEARSSSMIRISSSQSMSSGASVTRPSSRASAASIRRPVSWRSLATWLVVAVEAGLQAGQPVAHRERAEVALGQHDLRGLALLVVVLRARPACTGGRRRAPAPAARRRSSEPGSISAIRTAAT